MSQFTYLSEKILASPFEDFPFKHLLIEDFLSEEHLQKVITDPQIHWDETSGLEELISTLTHEHYKVQGFPGCTTNINNYKKHFKTKSFPSGSLGNPVETYGITFRLQKYKSKFIQDLVNYLNGKEFKAALTTKFGITVPTNIITAIQKNLSYYEISPHPDVREKGLTYLLNINKNSSVDEKSIHTQLLRFKKEWEFIYEYWKTNNHKNRCWVPWEWCETKVTCNKNNSIVLFSPADDTLHAIRLVYDHNKFQRTQIYGNLWGVKGRVHPLMSWKELKTYAQEVLKLR